VAIHGAFEPDPTRTWTHTTPGAAGGAEAPGVNWLADDAMLPSQVPHLRSWSFAYDTTPVAARDGGLQQHLARTAAGLRQVLEDQILADSTRPLLFVGHGYGGLVALKSLIDPHLRGRCAGVVCLGTPFRPVDMDNAIMETLPIAGRGSVQTLAVLADEFDTLPALLADFRDAPGTSAVPIRCFYETEPLRYNVRSKLVFGSHADGLRG
jgi:pimeloyl-ACP methyl ester carboxylesterase